MKNFTPEDLLEYHYGDMPKAERTELNKALAENWCLREKLDVIREAAQRLDKSMETPRQQALDFIKEYAAEHAAATGVL